jgi:hypothetical protein
LRSPHWRRGRRARFQLPRACSWRPPVR